MMTIKEFANLCSCNTQTLRYYDRINLLKPAKTDEMTGYRYYSENQAMDFVKIKNLQSADFSIDEIKQLILKDDDEIVQAFDEKIRMQTEKLEQLRQLQMSYLKEKKTMEKVVSSMAAFLIEQINDEETIKEFGFKKEEKDKIKDLVNKYFLYHLLEGLKQGKGELSLQVDDQMITGEDNVLIAIDSLDGSSLKETIYIGKEDTSFRMNEETSLNQFENVWEKHEWKNVSDWLDEVPPLSMDYQYTFFLEVTNKKENADLTFPMCLIASMIIKNDGKMINVGCDVSQSPDEFNHVKLYRVI